jgi:hypothetical protein
MKSKISYTLRKSRRARRLRLAVYCNGNVVVTTPFGVPPTVIDEFIDQKKSWLLNKIKFFKSIDHKAIRVFSREDYLKNKDKALKAVGERVAFYNKFYGFSFNRILIKNQKTRWGSCSRKRNLNFNYKVLFLSEEMRDYIAVHELCHLEVFSHSEKFWSLVAKVIPNYMEIKKDLRKHELFYK